MPDAVHDSADELQCIETFCNEFVGFVRITMRDGSQGWGQVSTYHSDITCQVLHRQVAPWTLGANTADLDDLLQLVMEREHKFPGSYLRRAMAGLDTAIWDMRGRRAEQPVCTLLGGSPGLQRVYASSMKRDITPEQEAERILRLRDENGYTAFKFRVGAECGRDQDEWPGRTEAIIPAIRQAVGDEMQLLADGNSCYSAARAIEVGRLLEAHGVGHFEEPCPYWEMQQTAEVTAALSIDVTGGEQDCHIADFQRMLDEHVVNVIQPDVCYLGGISRCLQVAELAATAGIPVTPHCANLSLVTLFTAHLLRALPNAGPYLEFSIEGEDYYPWQQHLFTHDPYQIKDGHLRVEDVPGWGIEPHPEWLARSTYTTSTHNS